MIFRCRLLRRLTKRKAAAPIRSTGTERSQNALRCGLRQRAQYLQHPAAKVWPLFYSPKHQRSRGFLPLCSQHCQPSLSLPLPPSSGPLFHCAPPLPRLAPRVSLQTCPSLGSTSCSHTSLNRPLQALLLPSIPQPDCRSLDV